MFRMERCIGAIGWLLVVGGVASASPPLPSPSVNVPDAWLTKAEASEALEALFGTGGVIAGALKRGERVQITGFGTFEARERKARTGRNPRTGEAIQIAASKAPSFKAGKGLKEAIQ